jgi:ParB family chromosome partitioning protein
MQTTVPLNKLVLSPLNARKTYAEEDLARLADNIHERGLHQNLVVSSSPTRRGFHEVDAGGRRWRALKRNVELGRLAADWPVPVKVVPREEAAEASLDENILKIELNPADEFVAYATIIAGYEAEGMADPAARIAQCARRRGVTVRHVQERLRLAALHPDILEALRVGRITLDSARAYAAYPDQELQLRVFADQEKSSYQRHSTHAIRAAFAGRIYRKGDRQVRYVGVDSYVAAGGRLELELFMGSEDEEVLIDAPLLERLCQTKASQEAQGLARDCGFLDGAIAPSSAAGTARAPAGFELVYNAADRLTPEGRAESIQIFRIARDGSGLEPTVDCYCRRAEPAAKGNDPSAPAASAVPRWILPVDSEAERQARMRRWEIEQRAVRLAMPAFAGTPFEGRAYWPPDPDQPIASIQTDDAGNFIVAILVAIPKAEVDAAREQAEWQLAEEEAAAAAAPTPAPAEAAAEAEQAEAPAEEPVA